MLLASSVLSLRGGDQAQVTTQPLVDETNGNILLWNGEIFSSDLVQINEHENDGFKLLNKLKDSNELFRVFESLKGPYAFVFFEKNTNSIFFGRDRLGRRSLLISANSDYLKSEHKSTGSCILALSSVKISLKTSKTIKYLNEFEELKANGIYKLDLNDMKLQLYEWSKAGELSQASLFKESYLSSLDPVLFKLNDNVSAFNDNITQAEITNERFDELVEKFYVKLRESVMRRVKGMPTNCKACSRLQRERAVKFSAVECEHSKLAVLFSGGIDSAVLAAVADECLPKHESIDLLNVAFEKQKSIAQKPKNKHK